MIRRQNDNIDKSLCQKVECAPANFLRINLFLKDVVDGDLKFVPDANLDEVTNSILEVFYIEHANQKEVFGLISDDSVDLKFQATVKDQESMLDNEQVLLRFILGIATDFAAAL